MRRIIYFAIATVTLAAAGLFSLPYLISGERINQRLEARIADLTENKLIYKGQPKLSLNPFLQIELFDVALVDKANADLTRALLYIEELNFSLKLLPLLFGKVRLIDFKLVRPKFDIVVDENGAINWVKYIPSRLVNSRESDAPDVQLGQIEIIDGIIVADLHGKPEPIRVRNLNADISWPDLGSAWEIAGDGVWSGEQFEFFNMTKDPFALFSSRSSPMNFSFNAPSLVTRFNGTANTASGIQLRGVSEIDIPSLPRLIELMGDDEGEARPPIGMVHIDGNLIANTKEIRFDEANVRLGDNVATGNLQFYRRGEQKAKLSGTLAFDSLDFTPFVEALRDEPQTTSGAQVASATSTLDMDVRFSAQSYKLGANSFGTIAATALISANDWTFDIGEADLFDGMVIATISSKSTDETDLIELKGTLRNISMETVARQWSSGDIFATGLANANFDLKAKDINALSNFQKFSGSINITMTDGRLEGIDIIKAIPALDQNNGFVTFDEIKGATPFGKLDLDLLVYNGVGWITNGTATNEAVEFRLSGKSDLLHGGLAIYTDIRELENAGTQPNKNTRMFVGGTVRNPLVTRSPLATNRPVERPAIDG